MKKLKSVKRKKGRKESEELQMKMIEVELGKEVIQKEIQEKEVLEREVPEKRVEEGAGQNHQEIDHLKTEEEHEVDLSPEESTLFQKVQGET